MLAEIFMLRLEAAARAAKSGQQPAVRPDHTAACEGVLDPPVRRAGTCNRQLSAGAHDLLTNAGERRSAGSLWQRCAPTRRGKQRAGTCHSADSPRTIAMTI